MLLIFAALFLLFGASRLPQVGAALGQTLRSFRAGLKDKTDA